MTSDVVLSDEFTQIAQWIIFTILCQAVDIFGIGTNIVNIICFYKQGFKDPVNISFTGLAVADLGCLITLIWTNICYTPAFNAADLPFESIEFQFLTSGMPHTTFVRVTACITAVITLERCLCITMPLKVKNIITTKSTTVIISSIFIVLISSVAPLYVVNKLDWKFYPAKNRTMVGIVTTINREDVEKASFAINNIFIPFASFIIVIACTITLVFEIKKKSQWRQKNTTSIQSDNVATRNTRVSKMVVSISTLFIVSFIPQCFVFMASISESEFTLFGKYKNVLILCGGMGFLLESINSSVNIFIYYQMSSKFRHAFREMFPCKNPDTISSKI